MRINSINQQAFKKLVIMDSAKDKLKEDIASSSCSKRDYQEALFDVFDTQNDESKLIKVCEDCVTFSNKGKGTSSSLYGPNLFVLMAKALKSARPDESKVILNNFNM